MAYTRPGVYVTETPLRAAPPRPNSNAVAAFFGTSDRGSTTPVMVDSWAGFRSTFGDLSQSHDLGYAVYHYFANGGRVAYVTRVAGAGATAASTAAVAYYANDTAASASLFTATAKNVGAWGNTLSLALTAGQVGGTATVLPTFNLQVRINNVEVEYWTELSADPASSRYFDSVLNEYSAYITSSSPASVTAHSTFSYLQSVYALASGSNGSTVGSADYAAALSTLSDVDGSLLINVVGQSSKTVVDQALTVASTRGNSFVIIDPDATATDSSSIINVVSQYGSTDTDPIRGYGSVYYPMVKMVDPMKTGPAAVRTTFPGGAIAGAFVRNDAQRTVAKTPAGYDIDLRNTLGLGSSVTDTLVSAVYDSGVNCLKAVPGAGVVVLGGRTLRTTSSDKYISIRRSLNYIKQNVTDLTRGAVFQPNGPQLWSELSTNLNKFLTTFWGQGGLKGQSSRQAFYVVCDETNNTATTIDNGEVHIEVGVALQYPAEFIVINVSQWTGGSNTSETL